jgi:hypothetical protein
MHNSITIVVTSVFEPNAAMRELARGAKQNRWNFIIVGDSKSPANFFLDGPQFFDLETQKKLPYQLARLCPERHYTRKNLGYLLAIQNHSSVIVETDDDNLPSEDFWLSRNGLLDSSEVQGDGWFNVYSLYSDAAIWPRGLPLENVQHAPEIRHNNSSVNTFSPIQQGLANGNPDVDAVYRLTQPLPLIFNRRGLPVRLSSGLRSPFNSQNTTWFKAAFPLLYLPSYCSFRMTDIWRSFVAQRIAWECGWQITYHDATVLQERNDHDLLRDFEQEIPGYLLNNKIKTLLEDTSLRNGVGHINDNLRKCYNKLIDNGVINNIKELDLLEAWIQDLEKLS